MPDGGWHFDKVVCLGIASFICLPRGKRSLLQLACVLETAKEQEKRGHVAECRIRVFAQEPKYTAKNVDFLREQEVTVLPIADEQLGFHHGTEHISRRTMLFKSHVPRS